MNSKIAVHTQHFLEVKQSTENEMRVSGQALSFPVQPSVLGSHRQPLQSFAAALDAGLSTLLHLLPAFRPRLRSSLKCQELIPDPSDLQLSEMRPPLPSPLLRI